MVQTAGPSTSLSADDYLCPLTTIRDALLRPEATATGVSIPKLRELLAWHKPRLISPWQPFKSPSAESRSTVSKPSFTLPQTTANYDAEEPARIHGLKASGLSGSIRRIALRVAEIIAIDEIDAFILTKSYLTYSVDPESDEETTVDRIVLWYAEEAVAVPQIALAALKLLDDEGDLGQLAFDVRAETMPDAAKYIEGLFRAFSGLAQKTLDDQQRGYNALIWTTLQLRQQESFLNLLFVLLYRTPNRTASISQGLLRGTIMSAFGTSQANREIWENDPECQRLATRIRDLTVIIAIESLCLGQVVAPSDPIEGMSNHLLQSKEAIASVNDFITEYSADIAPRYPEPAPESVALPVWPMPLICLAWAIILRSLPSDVAPSGGEGSLTWQDMAIRALRLPSGLFPWIELILAGPLFEGTKAMISGDESPDVGLYFRKVSKDLLIGLSELVQIESIADKPGLYRSWELLFGGGRPSTSSVISADFWIADFPYEERRSILDRSQFPSQPVHLLRILSALSGPATSTNSADLDVLGTDPSSQVHHYFSNLPAIAHSIQPSWCRYQGKDEQGREFVESLRTLVLPGGASVPRGSRGILLDDSAEGGLLVLWTNQIISGWALLLEIMQASVGLRSVDQHVSQSESHPDDSVFLSVRDLNVQESTTDIVTAGLSFLRSALHSSAYIKAAVLTHLSPDDQFSTGQTLLDLALTVLQLTRSADFAIDPSAISDAVDIIQALITAPSSNLWPALRSSGFFDTTGRKRSSIATLIQADSVKGEHVLTTAVLRLVLTLAENVAKIPDTDAVIIGSALHLVFAEVWNNFPTWRYKDLAKKFELLSLLVSIFKTILAHPIGANGSGPAQAAQDLIGLFISSTSLLTYRPIIEAVTQTSVIIPKLIAMRRQGDAELAIKCLDESLSLLASLFRVGSIVGVQANTLPLSLLGVPVARPSGDKLQFVDALFELAFVSSAQSSSIVNVLKTLRVYLEVIGPDPHRPSLASMLRNPQQTFNDLANLARRTDDLDVSAVAWNVLATVVLTQPGCVQACVGSTSANAIDGTLKSAIDEVAIWEEGLREAPHALVAVLAYLQSVLRAAGADRAITSLRNDDSFWQSIFDLSTRIVPAPPSFSLSMHSDDFTSRIQRYAYSVQAKANATSILASELAYALENDSGDQAETKARQLVLSLFRNNSALQEAGLMATHSSCVPELHEEQGKKVLANGGSFQALKTILLPSEREFGRIYLYDGSVVLPESPSHQASVNLALDLLNLNWSMLDADVALTRSFRSLAENVSSWTEGDGLATSAALRAGVAVAEIIAEEYRGGDVMLAIQVERLSILGVLLETALDYEEQSPGPDLIQQLSISLCGIITSQLFPPATSLRHPDLPAIHQPVLRILFLVLQVLSTVPEDSSNVGSRESLVDVGTIFALEAADVVLDAVVRGNKLGFAGDLSLVVSVLCEISKLTTTTTAWLDKVQGVNLVGRSLEVLVRAKIIDGQVPLHLTSILLLHLALAGNPSSAEKLAVSGILPAYSDNTIVVEAEHGRISPSPGGTNTIHDAWCGMLLVVKAFLSTLPDTASFTRTDVVPFIRVCTAQMIRSMSWDGESPMSSGGMMELELVSDVFHNVALALGSSSLADYSTPALNLLKSIRYALSHPRLLSTLIVPNSEEERSTLEGELELIEDEKEVDLVDIKRTPMLAGRTAELLRITRTVLLTLVVQTRSWGVIKNDVEREEATKLVLHVDEEESGASSDPVGIVNDIYLLTSGISDRLSSHTDPDSDIRQVANQILESAALLSLSQLQLRERLLPENEKIVLEDHDGGDRDRGMDLDSVSNHGQKRGGSRDGMVLRELVEDLKGMLSGSSGPGTDRMLGVLRTLADRAFGVANGDEQ